VASTETSVTTCITYVLKNTGYNLHIVVKSCINRNFDEEQSQLIKPSFLYIHIS